MPGDRAGPVGTFVKFFVGSYVVLFVVLMVSFAVGAPDWLVGVLAFVALLGLAAFVVQRAAQRPPP